MLQTRKYQVIELSRYAYFSNKTLESNLRKNIFIEYRTLRHDVKNYRSVCLDIFLKTFFMYARPKPVQTKVHFKNLQFLVLTYDMAVISCAFNVV